MIRMLGEEEALDMLNEEAHVEVGCDFCGQVYVLSSDVVRDLFDPKAPATIKLH